jgi:hypothetical protein
VYIVSIFYFTVATDLDLKKDGGIITKQTRSDPGVHLPLISGVAFAGGLQCKLLLDPNGSFFFLPIRYMEEFITDILRSASTSHQRLKS